MGETHKQDVEPEGPDSKRGTDSTVPFSIKDENRPDESTRHKSAGWYPEGWGATGPGRGPRRLLGWRLEFCLDLSADATADPTGEDPWTKMLACSFEGGGQGRWRRRRGDRRLTTFPVSCCLCLMIFWP